MNKLAIVLLGWLALGLELGLKPGLALHVAGGQVAPSFVFVVVAMVAMFATPGQARWCAVLLGLAMDATNLLPLRAATADVGGATGAVLGPHALGFLLGVQLVLLLRGSTNRKNPMTLGFLAGAGFLAAQCVLVAVFTFRSLVLEPLAWSVGAELLLRGLAALATALLGWLLGVGLLPLAPAIGLQVSQPISAGRWGGMRS